jgi:hypothetical protein
MGTTLRRLATLWPLVAVLAACSPPPAQAPAPAIEPGPFPSTAPPPPPPPPAPPPPPPLADPERNALLFSSWRATRAAEVEAFEEFMVRENVAAVVPTYQLLRSASMWKECRAEPFELPPVAEWPRVRDLLVLLRELRKRGVLDEIEVVSAYRDPRLNRCAGGAPGSSHQRFAVDIAPVPDAQGARLCRFWREEGQAWDMGVSRYPSGRIHIDRTGYRTWGASHRRGSSYCLE